MSKSSKPRSPGGALPVHFRPQDFGAPEPVEKSAGETNDKEDGMSDEDPLPVSRSRAVDPAGSDKSEGSRARPSLQEESHKVAPRGEQTILMAVPPPAQENKGE